jgi:hypothetical protein
MRRQAALVGDNANAQYTVTEYYSCRFQRNDVCLNLFAHDAWKLTGVFRMQIRVYCQQPK